MTTQKEIHAKFREELEALLAEYEAELVAEDHYSGWQECGEDVRISVEFAYRADDYIDDLDLGRRFAPAKG
jgi:hypothetical protein